MKSFSRVYMLMSLTATIVALGILSACSSNPIAAAQTVDQKAYALYGTFVIFEEQGAKVVQAAATPSSVRAAIKQADNAAKPVADNLLDATRQYIAIQGQLSAGATTPDKMQIATANLQSWVERATPLIQKLVAAVGSK